MERWRPVTFSKTSARRVYPQGIHLGVLVGSLVPELP